MRDFSEFNWSDGTEAIMALLPRLTVMRGILEKKPIAELMRLCAAVIDGDIRTAASALYTMTGALQTGTYRRVTGGLFKDMLLNEIFLSEHPFALMAAANRLDEALYNAMRDDLDVLSSLRELDGETLARFIQERYRELKQRIQPQRDLASRRAEAAWGGGAVRPADAELGPLPKLPAFLPSGAPNWRYGEEEMRDSYVSDEALEEMYHRFLEAEPGWSALNEDLWNFFAAYGSGEFLRVRHFLWAGGRLSPVEGVRPYEGMPFPEEEYRACMGHFIAFMRGESSEPVMTIGAEGEWKRAIPFSIADELPELRLVYVPECRSMTELMPLFDAVRDQPLKFAVALCDAPAQGFAEMLIPANVLVTVAGK